MIAFILFLFFFIAHLLIVNLFLNELVLKIKLSNGIYKSQKEERKLENLLTLTIFSAFIYIAFGISLIGSYVVDNKISTMEAILYLTTFIVINIVAIFRKMYFFIKS